MIGSSCSALASGSEPERKASEAKQRWLSGNGQERKARKFSFKFVEQRAVRARGRRLPMKKSVFSALLHATPTVAPPSVNLEAPLHEVVFLESP